MALPGILVETQWLQDHLQDPDLRILDCTVTMQITENEYHFASGRAEYDQGHIPGSVFVDVLGELCDQEHALPLMMPPPDRVAEIMAAHGVGAGTRVVLYDRGNHAWAARVWWLLRVCGFDEAAVLNGGWQKWTREERPVSAEPGAYPRGDFVLRHRPQLMAGKEEILRALEDDAVSLIHSLSPEEFSGASSRYQRPGRIPGSDNVFCQSLIDMETFTYLPTEELRRIFAATTAGEAGRVITYCGGGIAASSDALILMHLGKTDVAVYDGSLNEWTADPDLPMETG
jgi:thiosulfate/3-mercaptopyruvate sulfurtransferase